MSVLIKNAKRIVKTFGILPPQYESKIGHKHPNYCKDYYNAMVAILSLFFLLSCFTSCAISN